MNLTADYHQRHAPHVAQSAIELIADVYGPAREYAKERPDVAGSTWGRGEWFTIGYLTSAIETLLDALGYPEQGPDVDQRSWLPVDDEEDEVTP